MIEVFESDPARLSSRHPFEWTGRTAIDLRQVMAVNTVNTPWLRENNSDQVLEVSLLDGDQLHLIKADFDYFVNRWRIAQAMR